MATENSDPTNMDELIERIEQAWQKLNQLISALNEVQLERPGEGGWTIKDNLAHITAWEQFLIRHHLKGEPGHEVLRMDKAVFESGDEESQNDFLFQQSRGRPVAEVMADFRRSHQEVLATLKQMTFADLMRPDYPDDPDQRPLLSRVIGNTYDHYEGHGDMVREQLQEDH